MRAVTDAFLVAVAQNHTFYERVEVIDHDGTPLDDGVLQITAGDITEDDASSVRANGQLTVTDTGGLLPSSSSDLLMPFGRRIRITRGITYDDGTNEEVVIGTLWLKNTRATTASPGALTLTLYDRFTNLQEPSVSPINIVPGTPAPTAIRQVLTSRDPSLDIDLMTSLWTFPRLLYDLETDLVQVARDLAISIGAEVFMTRDDVCELRPIPTPAASIQPVTTFLEGANAVVTEAEADWDGDRAPNGVIVTAQHSSMPAPVRAEAWDLDPKSPTYRYGPYGEHPRFVRTEKATTVGQARDMAAGLLQKAAGGVQEVPLSIVPNPALEVGDIVACRLPSVGLDKLMVISRVQFTLAEPGAAMQITVRSGVAVDAQQ